MPHAKYVRLPGAHELCSEHEVKSGRHSAPRFFSTLDRYSCHTVLSFSSSFTIEPCNPAARSCGVTSPLPKCPARAMLLARTEIASAVTSHKDPLFSDVVEERFDALRAHIVRLEQEAEAERN